MGGECHAKGKVGSHLSQIEYVRNRIIIKERAGEDASWERNLLKEWSKYPGWEVAGEPIRQA